MRILPMTLGLMICWSSIGSAGEVTPGGIGETKTASAVVSEKIWDQYSQVFVRDLSGPERAEVFAQVMTNHPPIALIRLSPEQRPGRTAEGRLSGIRLPEGSASMKVPLVQVLRYAYHLDPQFPQNRIIVPADLANTRYDYIDTMARGGREVLQRELKEQFGVMARQEVRSNLVLSVKNPGVGLHKHDEGGNDNSAQFRSINMTMEEVASRLSKLLGVGVEDQTHLPGGYDFTLNLRQGQTIDEMKKAILEQLGLQLTPAEVGRPVAFLVAEKVHQAQ